MHYASSIRPRILIQYVQLNLVIPKSLGKEVLFRSIESSNYRRVDKNRQLRTMIIIIVFLSNTCFGCVKKRLSDIMLLVRKETSERRFFYAPNICL